METDFYLALRARPWFASSLLLALVLSLSASSGCTLLQSRNDWNAPELFSPADRSRAPTPCLAAAEMQYAAGQQAEEACNPSCVDFYFAAATLSWPYHVAGAATPDDRATDLYRSSVQLFIASAARFGRLNPQQGIVLTSGQVVPITYQAFVWQPTDFCTFVPVGTYDTTRLSNRYVSAGVGVPYVVLTSDPAQRPFTSKAQSFAATAVIAPTNGLGGSFALQLYDPLRASTTSSGLPLARDLTAPIAYRASKETNAWLEGFLRPDRDDAIDGLHMREPFQPGKIPVIFVHGLASDPLTWAQLENDLRAQPAIFSRFQFWYFRYDTGDPFLGSAARLRQQLAAARQMYDPMHCDPNMSRMVLVGHSMGGLISKLQVTYSGDIMWNAAAKQPFNTVITDPVTRANLGAAFFFQPSPDVTRVIYIATPHRGSSDANRCIGRLSSALIRDRSETVARHQQLVRDNPCLFRPEVERKVPNSVDLLEPDSPILQATEQLPYRYGVTLDSIIGDYRWSLLQGPTDGVVPVSSARIGGVQSELFVDAKHTEAQRVPETVREVICILGKHAAGM